MDRPQTIKLLAAIGLLWPRSRDNAGSPDKAQLGIELWHELLGDIDYDLAARAVKSLAAVSRYQPTIAEIREEATRRSRPFVHSAGEAWRLVLDAISRYGYYQEAEAMRSLPPRAASAAAAMGWEALCMANCATIGVERGQFCKIYDVIEYREHRNDCMPVALQGPIGDQIRGLLPDISAEPEEEI